MIEKRQANLVYGKSNHTSPFSIQGVAKAVKDSGEPDYLLLYQLQGKPQQAVINAATYGFVQDLFSLLTKMNDQELLDLANGLN